MILWEKRLFSDLTIFLEYFENLSGLDVLCIGFFAPKAQKPIHKLFIAIEK
jgi:hypothetical protein